MSMTYIEQIELIVCDLDGTLCDVRHRQHLAQAGMWDEFHSLLEQDEPRSMVLAFLQMIDGLKAAGMPGPNTVFLTGRPRNVEGETIKWLEEKCSFFLGDSYDGILTRPIADYRPDTVLKQELLEGFLKENQIDKSAVLILDDRDKVVAHLRDLGYEVWQIQEGAF
jgi:phosphoglycolate phosphatase-like HAD superfamily hydrolase